jgi:D-alanyl-D-alanine carboxypeptidase (penicillin-binding protein 5/6)
MRMLYQNKCFSVFNFLCAILLLSAFLCTGKALSFETSAKAAYILDQTTGTVILEKNANRPLPPASMSKLMTLYMAFEYINQGRLDLTEKLPVSDAAVKYRGSTMFLNTSDRVSVEDLLRGIIVLSGNDACVVLAEALSPDGTEEGFADLMTKRAKKMGMLNSVFANSNGWPHPKHRMSVKDLAILANRIITDFPEYYSMFAEDTFKFDGRAAANTRNRNPILGLGIGADGLKTGHTTEAGYGLVGSAVQGKRRVIFVITGLRSQSVRANEAEAIVKWAFRQFTEKKYGNANEVVGFAPVWNGDKQQVGLALSNELNILVPVFDDDDINFTAEIKTPIKVPLSKGTKIGNLIISRPNLPTFEIPLFAAENVRLGGFTEKVFSAAKFLLRSLNQSQEATF